MNSLSGIVFDLQRAALDDGPGLRTVVFLKGCPLRCRWCHNPESWLPAPQTGRSGKTYGREMTVDEVMAEVEKDRAFYDASGGGLTLSGGEPTFQFDFCRGLLTAAKEREISTCLDTCGHVSPERLSLLLPLVDLWHFDLKATGPEMYRNGTGVDGEQIERNLQHLLDAGARVRLRCPVVPGIHDRPEHRQRLEALENSGRFETVERLPYHDTGKTKYEDLNLSAPRFSAG